jgi:hypothetical protein
VAEQGHPRKEERTRDKGNLVHSLNNSSGDREGLGGIDRKAFPFDEIKPRLADVCVNMCILECLAQRLDTTVILMLSDYKYFFHQLVYEMAEIWKMGMAVPARAAETGAHHHTLDVLAELVMVGWTRASLIAQDLANALM